MASQVKFRKEDLYQALRGAILTLEQEPGADLDEATLSARYGLSRTPVREVLHQLAGDGYATIYKNRGVRVSEMSHKSLRDFFLTAPMIYGAVQRLAAQNATLPQIAQLKAAQLDFRKALQSNSTKDRTLANNVFHQITGEMADNPYLLPSFNRLLIDHARISMTFYRPTSGLMVENLSLACQQHDAIISSIEGRNEEEAAKLATEHWNLSRGQIEKFVMPTGLDAQLGGYPRNSSA